ncbi:small nuclear ribonucleo protein U2, A [Aulographum hederae CBS 113979]|uniref:U2 small nuclear ribonucleoprotein A' n=1 Tax=Aulographum hederae CBS 113979 TaxID=1176131 RepID=A0A6G1H7N9_9PEZI|nr:small nuclear ribonucleo protein U2, A [Aulographum hederae CBS 113979]
MRLTSDLVKSSLSYINPIKERELDLRASLTSISCETVGHQIANIENLGVAGAQECIDFTDNDISTVTNFPLSPKLQTLLLARNRVTTISPTLSKSIPNLSTIVLTENNISELADLDPLANFPKLTHVVLRDNPVTGREHYRYWIIWRCPSVRFLDFQKIKDAERAQAKELFGSVTEPTKLASKIMKIKSRALDVPSAPVNGVGGKTSRIKLTDAEKEQVKKMAQNAKTFAEMERLEKLLNEGRIPGIAFETAEDDPDRMEM